MAHQPLVELPRNLVARSFDRRIVNRLYQAMRRSPTQRRVLDLERRVNALIQWMQGLYPPAEYYVTGVR
jgi:hypothetical protein